MTEQELYNEYRKSDCKSFTDFLINKIANLKTDYEVLSCSVGDFGELQEKLEEEQRKNNGLSDNLSKAKTYLKYFIEILKKLGVDKEPLVIEAEQFIKDNSTYERIQKAKYNYAD